MWFSLHSCLWGLTCLCCIWISVHPLRLGYSIFSLDLSPLYTGQCAVSQVGVPCLLTWLVFVVYRSVFSLSGWVTLPSSHFVIICLLPVSLSLFLWQVRIVMDLPHNSECLSSIKLTCRWEYLSQSWANLTRNTDRSAWPWVRYVWAWFIKYSYKWREKKVMTWAM